MKQKETMMDLNGNTVVEMCPRIRKAIDRRSFFTVFTARTRKANLLLGTDGVLLTDDRKKVEGVGQSNNFHSIHQASFLGNCNLSHVSQFIYTSLEVSRAGTITPSAWKEMDMNVCLFFFFFFETRSHSLSWPRPCYVAQIALNSQSSCLLLSAGIILMYHHTLLKTCILSTFHNLIGEMK
jgi:hypothetical protein